MNKNINMRNDGNDVVVFNIKTKEEFFRKPKTRQTLSIANDIYMYHKYNGGDINV